MKNFLRLADATAHLLSFLDAYALLKLSMVSKQAKNSVDSVSANVFALTSPFYLRDGVGMHSLLFMNFDPELQQLCHEYVLEHPIEVHNMRLHAQMAVGRLVPMQLELQVPLDCVQIGASGAPVLSGPCPSSLRICVSSWEVVDVSAAPGRELPALKHNRPCSVAAVRLKAMSYRVLERLPSDTRTVYIPFAMILSIRNAPLDNSLSARERAVITTCVVCMNCHQRERVVRSTDVAEKQHRVLCRTCFSHLYTDVRKLYTVWRISSSRLSRIHHLMAVSNFVPVDASDRAGATNTRMKTHSVVLKEQMAHILGFLSWTELISNNYKTSTRKRGSDRYSSSLPGSMAKSPSKQAAVITTIASGSA